MCFVLRSFVVGIWMVLLGSGPVAGSSASSCLEIESWIQPGVPVTFEVEGELWFTLETRLDRVYEIDIETDRNVDYEMWGLWFDEGQQCHTKDVELEAGSVDDAGVHFDWTDPTPYQVGLRVSPIDTQTAATVCVRIEEIAAPPTKDVLVVPAVAHVRGAMGEIFQSDVTIFNPLGVAKTADLVLVQGGGEGKRIHTETIGPHQGMTVEDVVGAVFGLEETVGAMRIECVQPCRLLAVSRTYATVDGATYGQFIPALPWREAAGRGSSGATRSLLHLEKSDGYRSNVGFVEVLGMEAVLDLTMRGESGEILGASSLTLPASTHRQVNDIFDFLGVSARDAAWLDVEVKNQARVFVYGSVVDNRSSDPIFLPGLDPDRGRPWYPDAGRDLLVPAAASTTGFFGTRWRTDLRVQTPDGQNPDIEVSLIPHGGGDPISYTWNAPAGALLDIDDVVTLIGGTGSGFLRLHSDGGAILATTRTYTEDSTGTHGQFIPAEPPLVNLHRGTVLGLRGSNGFRSNVGLVNPYERPVVVTLELRSWSDDLLASRTYSLEPNSAKQLNDVFSVFGVSRCGACRLDYEAEAATGTHNIYVYGSVIDNRSGDAIFIPALPY